MFAITLAWNGPLGPGGLPETQDEIDGLNGPAVYLRVKGYEGGRLIAYVGQSRHLISRIDQHLVRLLSLMAPLRDDRGRPVYEAGFHDRLRGFNAIEAASQVALDDVKRVRFYFALCGDGFDSEYLDVAERLLKDRVAQRLGVAEIENKAEVPFDLPDWPIAIENDFTSLDLEGRETVARLLGDASIELPGDAWEAGFGE